MRWELDRGQDRWYVSAPVSRGRYYTQGFVVKRESIEVIEHEHCWENNALPVRPKTQTDNVLMHYGVPGMHWGEITKEYQPKGIRGSGVTIPKVGVGAKAGVKIRGAVNKVGSAIRRPINNVSSNIRGRREQVRRDKAAIQAKKTPEQREAERKARNRKIAVAGAVAVGAIVAAYGAKKYVETTKAKAYAGTLKRMLDVTPGNRMERLSKAEAAARETSGSFRSALATNRILKNNNWNVTDTKHAKAMYQGRDDLKKILDIRRDQSGKAGRRILNKAYSRARLNSYMKRQGAEYTASLGFQRKATKMTNQVLKEAAKRETQQRILNRKKERLEYQKQRQQIKEESRALREARRARRERES